MRKHTTQTKDTISGIAESKARLTKPIYPCHPSQYRRQGRRRVLPLLLLLKKGVSRFSQNLSYCLFPLDQRFLKKKIRFLKTLNKTYLYLLFSISKPTIHSISIPRSHPKHTIDIVRKRGLFQKKNPGLCPFSLSLMHTQGCSISFHFFLLFTEIGSFEKMTVRMYQCVFNCSFFSLVQPKLQYWLSVQISYEPIAHFYCYSSMSCSFYT